MYRVSLRAVFAALTVASFLIIAAPLAAQETGTISGRVIDSETAEPVFGVTVTVPGTNAFAQTDFEGRYRLQVPAGEQQIQFQGVSYETQTATINVPAGGNVTRNQTMGVQALDVVEVEGRALNNTEASMLALQRKSGTVSDGISAEAIKRSPDSSASDVLKRVTGITIVGGKFVFVRGLGERYSQTMLNDVLVASPEPDKRVVPLDLFPAGLIKNIRIIKTFSPEDPADFSGGIVKIETKEFPDEFLLSVGFGLGYNENTTQQHFRTYKGGGTDWLAQDDGTRDRPEIVDSLPEWVPFVRGSRFGGIPELITQLGGAQFNHKSWDPYTINAPVDRSFKLSLGDSKQVGEKGRFGYLFGTSYNRKWRRRDEKRVEYQPFLPFGRQFPDFNLITPRISRDIDRSNEEVLWGNNLNFSFEPVPNQRFSSQTLLSRTSEKYVEEGYGYVDAEGQPEFDIQTIDTGWIEREILHHIFKGEHALNLGGSRPHKLEWRYGHSRATRNEPDQSRQIFERDPLGAIDFYYRATGSDNAFKFYSEAEDQTDSFDFSYEIPFKQWNGLLSKFKLGALASDRAKDFTSDVYFFNLVGTQGHLENSLVPGDIRFSFPILVAPELNTAITQQYRVSQQSTVPNNYNAAQKIHAYFAQVDMPLVPKLRIITGARYEDSYQFVRTYIAQNEFEFWQYNYLNPGVGELRTKDLLPSVNTVYEATDDMNLRFGYTETLNRPDFRDLSEFGFAPSFGGERVFGNRALRRAYIHNYDARWEYYMSPEEYTGVGLFYKDLSDPITKIGVASQNIGNDATFINAKDGEIRGLEFEFRKYFLTYLGFQANLFFIRSRVEIFEFERKAAIDGGLIANDVTISRESVYSPTNLETKLPGQSDFVYNLKLDFYFNEERTGSIGLLYNIFGDRLDAAGAEGGSDRIEKGSGVLDLVYTQKFGENLSLKGSIKNILDTRFEVVQENPLLNREEIVRSYREGISYSVSLDYKF